MGIVKRKIYVLLILHVLAAYFCYGAEGMSLNNEVEMTAEELFFMEVPVVITAARKEQKQSETASATYVITEEDIRRSGVTTIPELLRMVPGLNVAQIDANKWAISSRGFNGRFANMLLVMIDGRSVYTPLFSGVYWDVQDTVIEDIERIEVVRGPGGTLWGANAVNGVINIITKSAKNTQGGLVTAGTGDQERGFGAVRYGGNIDENVYFRAYAKYFDRDNFEDGNDQWEAQRGGFRFDWNISEKDAFAVLGDFYDGDADETVFTSSLFPPGTFENEDTVDYSGGNILLRWQHQLSKDSNYILQTYFDGTERDEDVLDQRIYTYDIDFQYRFPFGDYQEITWGTGYRFIRDDLDDSFTVSFDPDNRQSHIFSVFLQDEIKLRENLNLTVGSKFEENDYSGFEIQPSARILWKMLPQNAVWGAVSRAVHTPSRSYEDIKINTAVISSEELASALSIFGNQDLEAENLLAYEIGYRHELLPNLSVDVATFYNSYDDLISLESGIPYFEYDPYFYQTIPLEMNNKIDGNTYGVELSANWKVSKTWRLNPGYTFLQMEMETDSDSSDEDSEGKYEGSNPEHQFQIRSLLNLPYNLEYDTSLYYVSRLHKLDVPSYTRFDMRLGWHPRKDLELSLSALNLLEDEHKEFTADDVMSSDVPRSFYMKVTWQF
ncbi:MAG: TonB-dependent receptor [Planctomycetes bacterium]|nr:TonB-dependent receptor [Planctomycetota bacterium]